MAIQFLRGTKSAGNNTAPAAGQPFYATDTKELYVGDGSTSISQLNPLLTCGEQSLATSQQIQAAKNIGAMRGLTVGGIELSPNSSKGYIDISKYLTNCIRLNGKTYWSSNRAIELGTLLEAPLMTSYTVFGGDRKLPSLSVGQLGIVVARHASDTGASSTTLLVEDSVAYNYASITNSGIGSGEISAGQTDRSTITLQAQSYGLLLYWRP